MNLSWVGMNLFAFVVGGLVKIRRITPRYLCCIFLSIGVCSVGFYAPPSKCSPPDNRFGMSSV